MPKQVSILRFIFHLDYVRASDLVDLAAVIELGTECGHRHSFDATTNTSPPFSVPVFPTGCIERVEPRQDLSGF